MTAPDRALPAAGAAGAPAPKRRLIPSLFAANLFLLFGIVVIIWVQRAVQGTLLSYLVGVAAELALALVVVLLVRLEKLPVRETLRLRWPGWKPMALSVVLAVGLWMAAITINLGSSLLFGYTTPVSPDTFPRNLGDALALLLATVVAAPLCEEVIFRGYVQRAYEARSPWIGLGMGGAIFALYHLRFQGVFALAPVALALGFVAWRTGSLLPGMLLHAVYNGFASLLLVASSFWSLQVVTGLMLALLCLGVVMAPLALVALWGVWRVTHPPEQPRSPRPSGVRRWAWPAPLIVLLLIYGYAAFAEIVVGRYPEVLAADTVELQASQAWEQPVRWTYELHTALNQKVGEAQCTLAPQSEGLELTCDAHQDAFDSDLSFDISILNLTLASEERSWQQRTVWSHTAPRVATLEGIRRAGSSTVTLALSPSGVFAVTRQIGEVKTVAAPVDALFDGEWPWRLSALPFEIAYGGSLPLVEVDRDGVAHVTDAQVTVRGGEPVWTPAGNFVTWKVTLLYKAEAGEQVELGAWYDIDAPHTLVRYDDGTVSYLLKTIEQAGKR